MKKRENFQQGRLLVCGIFLGFVFAGMNTLGIQISTEMPEGLSGMLRDFILCLPVATAISIILLWSWDMVCEWINKCSMELRCSALMDKKRMFWLIWAGIFLLWIPAFLAAYPGVYVIDNVFQIQWYMKGEISAHHPILHTYFLGWCIEGGKRLFGSYEAGLAMYSILQMLVLSGIFSYVICAFKKRIPSLVRIFCVLLYAFLPYHAVSSFTATKDVLYAGLFMLVVLKTYEIVIDMDCFFSSRRKVIEYSGLIFLSCCFRNTGIYIFLCMIPFMFFACRKYWKQILAVTLVVVVLWGVFSGPVYGILGIKKGSSAEMLSVPMQQMSRALLMEGEKLSEDERQAIIRYIPDYERYESKVADPVKDTFQANEFEKSPAEFVKLWIRTGLKCPNSYVQAFFILNMGFWWPGMEFPDPGTYLAYIPYKNADIQQVGDIPGETIYIQRESLLPEFEEFYEKHVEEGGFEKVPFYSWLYSPGAFFWFVCFGIVLCIYKKRYKMAVPFSLFVALWLSLMVSPVVVFRYAYPMMVCLPVLIAMMSRETCAWTEKGEKNE